MALFCHVDLHVKLLLFFSFFTHSCLKQHEGAFLQILAAVKGSQAEKRLASQFIARFFKFFPKLQENAIDAMLDLCEDEDNTVRPVNSLTPEIWVVIIHPNHNSFPYSFARDNLVFIRMLWNYWYITSTLIGQKPIVDCMGDDNRWWQQKPYQ